MKHLILLTGLLSMLLHHQVTLATGPTPQFIIEGRLAADQGDLRNARVIVVCDQVVHDILSNDLDLFVLDLEVGHRYLLRFEADGMVAKSLCIDTHVRVGAFRPSGDVFRFAVTLHAGPSDGTARYDGPVGMIHVDTRSGALVFDPDHRAELIVKAMRAPRKEVMTFVDPTIALGDRVTEQQSKGAGE